MKQFTLLTRKKSYQLEISEPYLESLHKKDLPGISLGKLITFRDEYAKELDTEFPCKYESGKCDVLNEVLSFFVFAIDNYDKAEHKIKRLFTDCWYLINDNFRDNYDAINVDLDNWVIYPEKAITDPKNMNVDDSLILNKQLKKVEQ